MSRPLLAALAAVAFLAAAQPALACDICAVYTGFELQRTETGPRLGLGEQFTRFATLQDNSHEIANPAGQYLESSITQLLFGYQFTRRFGLQLNLPIIHRGYRRLVGDVIENGAVSGFGDLSLVGTVLAWDYTSEETVVLISGYLGLQLPSGDSSLLGEEVAEPEPAPTPIDPRDNPDFFGTGERPRFPGTRGVRHSGHGGSGDTANAIHGHDLALGSGSVDGIFGAQAFGSWRRLYASAVIQYSINETGSFDYRYANELVAAGGPGAFLLLHDDYTLGLQGLVSVDTKGTDTVDGEREADTGFTRLYFGPQFHFTWSTKLAADFGVDFPFVENNTGLQVAPNWRLRLGAVWRF
jgi:hypothetical protein